MINGVIIASLKTVGNMPSFTQVLTMLVIGLTKAGRHYFRYLVGMISKEHVASEAARIVFQTSSSVAGLKTSSMGGAMFGVALMAESLADRWEKDEQSFLIFPVKNSENLSALFISN